jgi:hypothetical protein
LDLDPKFVRIFPVVVTHHGNRFSQFYRVPPNSVDHWSRLVKKAAVTRPSRPQKEDPIDLPEPEWNFERCPKEEIEQCWLYEFSREVDWLKAAVAKRRAPITTKFGATARIDTLTRFARHTLYAFLLMPQWPAVPYLSVPEEERRMRIEWTRLQTDQEFLASSLVPTHVPDGIEKELADCYRLFRYLRHPRVRSEDNLSELALIRIDWTRPDSELVQAFEAYIKEFRPLVPGSLAVRYTGKRTPDSKMLQQLVQLGRFRLLRANGNKFKRVEETGHLAGSPDSWYRARKAVEALIKNSETLIVPRLSRAKLECLK